MTKIDVFSGFLGAGKTTLIKKLIDEAFKGEKIVLIENEFGEIGIDSGFLKDSGVQISEMNSGCICCTLVGDFAKSMKQVLDQFHPDRILIEPSGVGKLSDVIDAISGVIIPGEVEIDSSVTVVDVKKCSMYMKNFGEFYNNQVQFAKTIILSRSQNVSDEKLDAVVATLKEMNPNAVIITTPWDQITGEQIKAAMEHSSELFAGLLEEASKVAAEHHHHHHHDDDDDEHEHHHHHHDDDDDDDDEHEHHHHHHHDDDDDDDEHEHHHHHHHDDDDDDEHEHHHHHHHDDDDDEHEHHHHHDDDDDEHEHHHHHHHDDDDDEHEHHHHHHDDDDDECDDPECSCHHHHHHHHHGDHDADEVFESFGFESPKKFTKDELEGILKALSDTEKFGIVVRAKGIVPGTDGVWFHFDFVPGEFEVRTGSAEYTGRLCVIGSKIDRHVVKELFGI